MTVDSKRKVKRLRPLGLADLLDETVELYRSNFALIVGISAAINLPIILLNDLALDVTKTRWSLLTTLVSLAVTPVLSAALIVAISERYLDQQASVRSCCRRAIKGSVYWPVLGAETLQTLIAMGCLCVGVIPAGIVGAAAGFSGSGPMGFVGVMAVGYLAGGLATSPLWARVALAEPVVILEKQGASVGINRSWSLMSGSVVKSALAILVSYILVYGLPTIGGMCLVRLTGHRLYTQVPLMARIVQQLVNLFISVVLGPLVAVTKTLLYFDLRVRKEGFDVELLAKSLEQKEPVIA